MIRIFKILTRGLLLSASLLNYVISYSQATSFQHTYGLPGYNYGVSSFQTADSGYMILGNKSGFSGNSDIYIIKTDKNGGLIWDRAIGGDSLLWATSFRQTQDKGLVITGYTNHLNSGGYDFLIIKTDSLANVEWIKSFGGDDWDIANSVVNITGWGYIIAGKTYSNSAGMADAFFAGINLNGDTLWTRTLGGSGNDVICSIDTTSDGNFIAGGYTSSFGAGGYDFLLVKLNNAGDTLWTRTFGFSGDDKAYCARTTIDGGYAIAGSSNSPPAQNIDPWLVKTDINGNYMWNYIYFNVNDEEFFDIRQKSNGLYVMAGYTTTWGFGNKELFTHVVLANGDFLHGHTYGGPFDDVAYSAGYAYDGGYFFTGTTDSKGIGLTNIYFVKTDTNCFTDTSSSHEMTIPEDSKQNISLNVFPNPASEYLNVSINNTSDTEIYLYIYDFTGNVVLQESIKLADGEGDRKYNISNFNQGIYLAMAKGKKLNKMVKFTIIRH